MAETARPGTGRMAGRRVLVVGGGQQSHGIEDPPTGNGRAIALVCAREGAAVAVADIDLRSARETVELVGKEGGAGAALAADATDEPSVVGMVEAAEQALGGLDGLVL